MSRVLSIVIVSLFAVLGCTADDPSSGLDVPAGCQCGEPLGELDRRLRAVEAADPVHYTGTFTPPPGSGYPPEGATMEVGVTYQLGDWWLFWRANYTTTSGMDSALSTAAFAIPYPTEEGETQARDVPTNPAGPHLTGVRPSNVVSLSTSEVVVTVDYIGGTWTFRPQLPPIPTGSAMVLP